jgi:hypothetical protein
MSRRFRFSFPATALTLFLALGAAAHGAASNNKPVKETGGNSNSGTTYVDGTAAGTNDVVKIDGNGKKVTVVETTTWGAVDFSAGTIDVTGTQTLNLVDTTSVWTGGLIDGVILNSSGITLGSGTDPKQVKGGAKLNLSGTTSWTGGDLSTGGGSEIINLDTFTTSFDGKITNGEGGTLTAFKNKGSFTKTNATTGTTEIAAVFDNNDTNSTVTINGGTLKLIGGGTSTGTVTLANNTKLQIADANYSFSGANKLNAVGDGAIDVTSAVATFNNTSGSANLNVSGTGTALINGSHSTTGRLKLTAGKLDATLSTDTTTVAGFDGERSDYEQ